MSYVKNLDINGSSYDIKSLAIEDMNSGNAIKTWSGTKAAYTALVSGGTVDSNTYYTCTDTGELYLGEIAIGKPAPFRNVGEIVSSVVPLTDAGLHLLDGALIQGSGIYSAFVTAMAAISVTNPELFCTEQEWQQSVTDYGVCGKFVYDSVNNTLRLQKFYSAERYLIASYSNGTQWCRVYSDGWCEQGGYFPKASSYGMQTVTFLKPYKDTNYNVLTTVGGYNTSSAVQFVHICALNKTASSFQTRNDDAFDKTWQACGYIDISTYKLQTQYQYIVIATTTKTAIQVDIDEIATDLNGKADVDLTNCTKPHIVETYVNGTSWYRVYSDGWCEQGGYSSTASTTINLLKPFIDTNYTIATAVVTTATGGSYTTCIQKNTAKFIASGTQPFNWHACGYIS